MAAALAAGMLLFCAAGCGRTGGVALRRVPSDDLLASLKPASWTQPQPSMRTVQLLRRYDLVEQSRRDTQGLLDVMQQLDAARPSAEMQLAMAELACLAAMRHQAQDPARALALYAATVSHAYAYLFDEALAAQRNPYDPQYRGACDLYNRGLQGMLRGLNYRDQLRPGARHTVGAGERSIEIVVAVRSPTWRPEDFDRFEFASDYDVTGLTNRHQTYGLGVPLIAVRSKKPDHRSPGERYYPPDLSFPATAFLRLGTAKAGEATTGTVIRAVLELYDPLVSTDIVVENRLVPLESDLTTPLAYFLDNPQFGDYTLSTTGLLDPSNSRKMQGLYMLEPYQPGKIPVLMVHGLWSSPMTWLEMFNDLRSQPDIRQRYQFWFYLYPTGQPFWHSAAELREELATLRQRLDPQGREPALDEMVLVGHSMGGLVAMLQALDGGDDYWRTASSRPPEALRTRPETRQALSSALLFRANPSIRRVVTIGTPFRGSDYVTTSSRWVARKFIKLPDMVAAGVNQLRRDNPGAIPPDSVIDITTGIDSLAPDSPLLPVLLASPRPTWVRHHNIVGVVEKENWLGRLAGGGDGVVPFESASLGSDAAPNTASTIAIRLPPVDDSPDGSAFDGSARNGSAPDGSAYGSEHDSGSDVNSRRRDWPVALGADSEWIVPAYHVSLHRHPRTILEVRRILLEHAASLPHLAGRGRTEPNVR
jgi:pimeloyl-ACP methyl ester carboxylesterase